MSSLYVKYRLKVMLVRIPRLSREPSKKICRESLQNWMQIPVLITRTLHVYRRVYPQIPLDDNSTDLKYVEGPNFVFLTHISVVFVSDFFFLYYIWEFSNVDFGSIPLESEDFFQAYEIYCSKQVKCPRISNVLWTCNTTMYHMPRCTNMYYHNITRTFV